MKPIMTALVLVPLAALASPPEMREMPQELSSHARIAPVGEPGQRLVIEGTLVAADGVTPASGVVVYGYHTDVGGTYGPHARERRPRLRGWARTDAQGRFEFETIRPAPYPGREIAAHVHFSLCGAGVPWQFSEDLLFDDDPRLTKGQRDRSQSLGRFANVCKPVPDARGGQRCTFVLRALSRTNFPG